jgi:hypothetical protein
MRSKAISLFSTLVTALLLAISTADAQSIEQFTANIPFEFNLAGATHPAGTYVIWRHPRNMPDGFLLIRSARGNDSEIFRTIGAQAKSIQSGSSLVFNRYEDQYFLAKIWTAGDDTGRQLVMTSRERRIKRKAAGRGMEAKTVSIAANVP